MEIHGAAWGTCSRMGPHGTSWGCKTHSFGPAPPSTSRDMVLVTALRSLPDNGLHELRAQGDGHEHWHTGVNLLRLLL
eukprot:361241-Chlamydomonas_euryale.AAC.7